MVLNHSISHRNILIAAISLKIIIHYFKVILIVSTFLLADKSFCKLGKSAVGLKLLFLNFLVSVWEQPLEQVYSFVSLHNLFHRRVSVVFYWGFLLVLFDDVFKFKNVASLQFFVLDDAP
jgi:hypothetical protein